MFLAMVRIFGFGLGALLGILFMAAVKAGAGTAEFPTELQFLQNLAVVMRDGECFANGPAAPAVLCEIRAGRNGGASPRVFYVLHYRGGRLKAAHTFTLYPLPPGVPRGLAPQEMKVVIRGTCAGEEFGVSPARCEFLVRLHPRLGEEIYLIISGQLAEAERYYGVRGGTVLLEPPWK